MRAAVEAATKDEEPPPLLSLYWQCMKWETLPKAGGMYDQEYKTMSWMEQLFRVYDAAYAWHNSPKDMTADQKRAFSWLHKMGLQ